MTSEKQPDISVIKTHELLSKAQMLLRDLQELLDWCSTDNAQQMRRRTIQPDFLIDREDRDETLVIEGFKFDCTTSKQSLQKLCSQDGSGCHFRRETHD